MLNRLIEYAEKTKVKWTLSPRLREWVPLGLPAMGGFTPHLREVHIPRDAESEFKNLQTLTSWEECSDAQLWMIHDLLHIMFYDYASYNLGVKSWSVADRFFESHLASETFAILALDYFALSHTQRGGLAVDVNDSSWHEFQKFNSRLPEVDSLEWVQALTDLYLNGHCEVLESGDPKKLKRKMGKNQAPEAYQSWLGHEIRYSQKQRFYVALWWNDLQCKNKDIQAVTIENSAVVGPLYELLELIFRSSDKAWTEYLYEISNKSSAWTNVFSELPKYKAPPSQFDFRLTDHRAVSDKWVATHLREAKTPNPSDLFLFWQIVATVNPQDLLPDELRTVAKLAKSSQTPKIDFDAWQKVRRIAAEKHSRVKARPEYLAMFFLP